MDYNCERCKYSSCVKQNYNKHINSDRHKQKIDSNITLFEIKCITCDKLLLSKTSLWRHSKICNIVVSEPTSTSLTQDISVTESQETKDMLKKLIDGQELLVNGNIALKQLIVELTKTQPSIVTNNTKI